MGLGLAPGFAAGGAGDALARIIAQRRMDRQLELVRQAQQNAEADRAWQRKREGDADQLRREMLGRELDIQNAQMTMPEGEIPYEEFATPPLVDATEHPQFNAVTGQTEMQTSNAPAPAVKLRSATIRGLTGIAGPTQMPRYTQEQAMRQAAAAKQAELVSTPYTLSKGGQRYVGGELIAENPEEQKSPTVGSFEDYVVRTAGQNPTPEQIRTARREYGDSGRAQVQIVGGTPSGTGALTPEGTEYAATQYRVTGVMPPMGMGNSQARAAIINEAARQAKSLRQTPAMVMQRQASFTADKQALGRMRTMQSAAESFEAKALAQADKVVELSSKVGRSKWPIVNGAIMAGKTDIAGDKDATLFLNAVLTFTSEYAKIIEGSTGSAQGSSDAARRATEKLLNPKFNHGTVVGAVDLMKWEMGQTIQGYDATINHISERMGGAPPTTQGEGGTPQSNPAPAGGGSLYEQYLKRKGQ